MKENHPGHKFNANQKFGKWGKTSVNKTPYSGGLKRIDPQDSLWGAQLEQEAPPTTPTFAKKIKP
jgi:hypothetical protein